jgi:hypothetical protein
MRNGRDRADPRGRRASFDAYRTLEAFDTLPIEIKRVLWNACADLHYDPTLCNTVRALQARERQRVRRRVLATYGPDHPQA